MSPGSRVPSGVCPSKGMPPFPILPPSGAEAPFRESTKVLTWVALCVQPGGHRADAAGSARSRPHTCPVQGRRGQGSEIQASHMPSAGQTRLGQRDPGLTHAHCPADVAGAVQSRPHTCPLQGRRVRVSEIQASHVLSAGQWPGQRDPGLTHALCRADAAGAVQSRPHTCPLQGCREPPQGAHYSHNLFIQEPEAQRRSSTGPRTHSSEGQSRSHHSPP